jgi:hypothetical protein
MNHKYNTNPITNAFTNNSSIFQSQFLAPTYQTNPYIPMINVPTTSKLPSPGEIVTSVELLTKHVSELSCKIDRIESRVNDWVNLQLAERMTIAERGITALKTCHNDHDEKIAHISQYYLSEKDGNDLYERIQDLVDQNEDGNKCLDRFSDILNTHTRKLRHAKHRSRDLAKKCAEIGILRRRVSKVEDNNTEISECLQTTREIRGVMDEMMSQLNEYKERCEYLESMNACMTFNSNSHIEDLYRDLPSLEPIMCDENMELCEGTDLNAYFSNYWDKEEDKEEVKEEVKENINDDTNPIIEVVIDMDEEFKKNPEVSSDDNNNEDEDFEKL